jgi:YD repeat-containing protein
VSLAGYDQLAIDVLGNILMIHGSGAASEYFTRNADGTFASPPGDFGTFAGDGNGNYVYTSKDGTRWFYSTILDRVIWEHETGLLTSVVDSHGLAIVYNYDDYHRIASITMPDGNVTHFVYLDRSPYIGFNWLTNIIEPGNRVISLG